MCIRDRSAVASRVDAFARCVARSSFPPVNLNAKSDRPRRPRTRGRTFDARARLCAAKIHTPNINQRCPRSWASLTCLVGTLLARVRRRMTDVPSRKKFARRRRRAERESPALFSSAASLVFFAYDPTPDGKDELHVPRVPSCAPDRPRCDSCCRPRLSVSVRCVFLRAFITHEPACHGVGSPSDRP